MDRMSHYINVIPVPFVFTNIIRMTHNGHINLIVATTYLAINVLPIN